MLKLTKKTTNSVAIKLNLMVVALSLVLLFSLGLMLLKITNEQIKTSVKQDTRNIVDSLTIAVQTNAAISNLKRVVSTLAVNENVNHISLIRNRDGQVLADNYYQNADRPYFDTFSKTEQNFLTHYINAQQATTELTQDNLYFKAINLNLIDPKIMRLRRHTVLLVYDQSQSLTKAYQDYWLFLAIAILYLLIMVGLVYLVQRKIVIRPINKLMEAIEKQKHSEQAVKVEISSTDELGVLANSFEQLTKINIQQKNELIKAQEYLNGITNSAPVLLFYLNRNLTIEFINHSVKNWFGNDLSFYLNTPFKQAFGQDYYQLMSPYFETSLTGEVSIFDEQIQSDGTGRFVHVTLVPRINTLQQTEGIFVCIEDITELKSSQQRLEDYAAKLEFNSWALEEEKEKAEAATIAKSQFLAAMSHEIRTPMNGVLGTLGLLSRSKLNDEQKHQLKIATSSAESLLSLINDILDFSKVEAGKMDIENIDFNLIEQISDFVEAIAPKAKERSIDLILDMTQVQEPMVEGDPGRIRQIFTNLVSNAIKFTKEGHVMIEVALQEEQEQWLLSASVTDTGIGIPEEKQSNIFEAFSQADSSTTRKFGGTGLGLSIVKQLCLLMSGDINLISTPNVGSCFSLHLKLNKSSKNVNYFPDLSNQKILIYEPHSATAKLLSKQLQTWNAQIVEVTEEQEMLSQLEQQKADFNFIAIDGLQNPSILSDKELPEVLAITNHPSQKELAKQHKLIQKPITPHVLIEQLTVKPNDNTGTLSDDQEKNNWCSETRILLVEDNPVNQYVAKSMLTKLGVQCDLANNGIEALDTLKSSGETQGYDIIFMDGQMPEMDGYETTKAIRNGQGGERYMQINIIALTANAMTGDREKCIQAGMNDYLSKPVQLEQLKQVLTRWLPQ